MQHAQVRGIVHRDLKPSNTLVSDDGQIHLLDFGIAALLQDQPDTAGTRLTQFGLAALTPGYALPEQLRGERVSPCTDVFALGVLFYDLITGQLPYRPDRPTMAALEAAQLAQSLRGPAQWRRRRSPRCAYASPRAATGRKCAAT